MDVKFFRLPEVVELTGLRPSTVYKLIRLKQFPPGVKLSQRSTGWNSRAIEEWIANKISSASVQSDVSREMKGAGK